MQVYAHATRARRTLIAIASSHAGLAQSAPSAAPAPKAAHKAPTAADWTALGKLPDFTGVWEIPLGPPRAAATGRGAAPRTGGGRGPMAQPSLTPEYAAKAAELAKVTAKAEDNLSANCLPPGIPAIMGQPYPVELLMTPGLVTIVIEAYTQVRHIYTDRPMPDDPEPSFDGTSIGHWEGDTLVVETAGFEEVPRGISFPYSDKMKIVERMKLSDPDTLNIETTIQDPLALSKPFSMGNRVFKRHRSWTVAEYVCEENNRNFVDEKGKAGINLANPTASPK